MSFSRQPQLAHYFFTVAPSTLLLRPNKQPGFIRSETAQTSQVQITRTDNSLRLHILSPQSLGIKSLGAGQEGRSLTGLFLPVFSTKGIDVKITGLRRQCEQENEEGVAGRVERGAHAGEPRFGVTPRTAEALQIKVAKLYNAREKKRRSRRQPGEESRAGRRSRWGGASFFVSHFSLRHIFSTLPF